MEQEKLITVKEVEHIAKLSRLALSEEEKGKFVEQIGNILNYFNQLKEVNTENVEPMTQPVPKINVMREDKVCLPCDRDEMLANAPEEENSFFKVPKISEE